MNDPNRLFARAEQAYLGGRFDEARAGLIAVRRAAGDHPRLLHLLALVEERRGDMGAARAAFAGAVAAAPGDGALQGSYARFLGGQGEAEAALAAYEQAIALAPPALEARYNRALLLQRLGRPGAALADLDAAAAARPQDAKIHSARGAALRALGRLREAGAAYDQALTLEPRRPTALAGRATVAKERGEAQAAALYRRALAARPGDPQLVLGLAEALEMEGDPAGREVLARAVAAQPAWAEGQEALARMRWEAGEGLHSTRGFEQALAAAPGSVELWTAYARSLGAADLSAQAADAAARGRAATGDNLRLTMIEAVRASEAGQAERADRLFAGLPQGAPGRSRMEMRHRIRCGDYAQAAALGEAARAREPWDVATWAMTGLLWRLLEDPRAQWLLGQEGLVAARELPLSRPQLDTIADRLRRLHTTRAHPPGQSLRGGTQTRGLLFEREEPEVALLKGAIERAVGEYWGGLPAKDAAHPLLRHREARPRFAGSWSVRLTGGGFHIAHYHPNGVLSSACYLVVPQARAPMEGWLEIGGPPEGMNLVIEPVRRIEPRPGLMALFPSFFFHGTRPFAEGERLTVAFDIAAG
jgi:tetratricopeptide (TPR) repeat protein